jgi:hypothetical protein
VFQCTRALEFAHKLGVTHRDIKPANILHTGETDVKITEGCRHKFDRTFMEILVERLAAANLRLSGV